MTLDQHTGETALGERVSPLVLIREFAASGLAAATAGLLVGGVGGRLAMRLSGFLNPDLAGRLTEARQRVGAITAAGTVELLIFGGLLVGILAAVPWIAIRPWMPTASGRRSLVAATAAVAILGGVVVEANNFDFSMLQPAWLHVVMFTVLVGAAGWLTASLDARFVRRLRHSRGFTYFAVPVFGLVLLDLIVAVAVRAGDADPAQFMPRSVRGLVAVALLATGALGALRLVGRMVPSWLHLAGRLATTATIATGLFFFTETALEIL